MGRTTKLVWYKKKNNEDIQTEMKKLQKIIIVDKD